MLTVKTSLRQSATHGMGVFAEEFIPAGVVVWQFQPDFDFRVSEESVATLPEIARQKLLHYSAKWGGGYVISADDARFLNHSETPNLRTHDEPDCDIAIRDIQIGEELLEDYREFDDTFAGRAIDRHIGRTPVKDRDLIGHNLHLSPNPRAIPSTPGEFHDPVAEELSEIERLKLALRIAVEEIQGLGHGEMCDYLTCIRCQIRHTRSDKDHSPELMPCNCGIASALARIERAKETGQ